MPPINVSGFNVGETPYREYGGTTDFVNAQLQNRRLNYQQQKDKESDDWKKYQIVKDTIRPEDVAVGNASFDEWSDQETKRVFKEVMSDPMIKNGSFVDFYGMVQSKWNPVVNAADKFRTGMSQIDANVKLSGTEDTNLATDKLAADSKLQLVQDTMPMGQDGKRIYNTANYNPDKNYVQDILGSGNSWMYVKSADPLIKYIENHKTEDVNLEKHLSDKSIIPYKGKKSPFTKLNIMPDANGVIKNTEIPSFTLNTEDDYVTNDDGTTQHLKLLSEEVYEQHINKIPANKKIMDALWNQYKQREGVKSKNATEEEKRKRAFAVGVFEAHDPSQIPRQKSEHLPRNTTNNNFGGAGRGGDLLQYDVLGTYEKKIQNFRSRVGGKWGDTFKAVRVEDIDKRDMDLIDTDPYYDNGATYYKVRPDGDWEGADGQVISWAKVAQANLDKTTANEALRNRTKLTADKTKNQQPTGKTESYTRAELKGKGWTDALIDKAVKEGKIKLK